MPGKRPRCSRPAATILSGAQSISNKTDAQSERKTGWPYTEAPGLMSRSVSLLLIDVGPERSVAAGLEHLGFCGHTFAFYVLEKGT